MFESKTVTLGPSDWDSVLRALEITEAVSRVLEPEGDHIWPGRCAWLGGVITRQLEESSTEDVYVQCNVPYSTDSPLYKLPYSTDPPLYKCQGSPGHIGRHYYKDLVGGVIRWV